MKFIFNKTYTSIREKLYFLRDAYYSDSAFKDRKVDFLIIGAQKCGTTSLFHFLNQHPQCVGARNKEVGFFSKDILFSKGIKWYHRQFDISRISRDSLHSVKFFEATPVYIFNPLCVERISEYNPNIKMILLLREPVARAYSAWNMWREFRDAPEATMRAHTQHIGPERRRIFKQLLFDDEFPSFDSFVARELDFLRKNKEYEMPFFVKRGLYCEQIKKYYQYFSKGQLLVLNSSQFNQDKIETLSQIQHFLGLEPFKWQDGKTENKHVRGYVEPMDPDTKERLQSFYLYYNEALFNLIEKRFEDWEYI